MCCATKHRQRGFSLIEILVGVTIGVVGILVMFQTLAAWTARASSTDSGGDAQITGALAMFNLKRDVRLAGLGFGTANPANMGCGVTGSFNGVALAFQMAPVVIAHGANGAPDTVRVLHGNSSSVVVDQGYTSSNLDSKRVETWRSGFYAGDLVVASSRARDDPSPDPTATACVLVEITDLPAGLPQTLQHASGNYTHFYTVLVTATRFNPIGGIAGAPAAGTLFNLGPEPRLNLWQVNAGVLSSTDILHNAAAFAVAEGVVDLQAQYGVDNNNDQRIGDDEWTENEPKDWAAPNDWTRVRAIRVALLVRSKQFERPAVTPTANTPVTPTKSNPGWKGGAFVMTNVDGTADAFKDKDADPNNWRNYRYRVYEEEIPLRNILWGNSP